VSADREFLRRVWALENERPAFQFAARANTGTTALQRFNDVGLMMEQQLAEFGARPPVADDSVPAFFPYLGTTAVASAFGCPLQWLEDDDPWATPLIDADPAAVYALPTPAVTGAELGRVLSYTTVMAAAPQGLPVRMTDIQGPLDSAALIWSEDDLLLAMYDNPAEVHHLLGAITRLTIDVVLEQRRLVHRMGREFIPCHFPQIWMPDGAGIALSDDAMALLPADLYREFALPYINQFSEAFGGVFLHACGRFTQNLENLRAVRNLRGLDFAASEMPAGTVSAALGGKAVLSVRLGENRDIPFGSIQEFVAGVLRSRKTVRGLYFVLSTWYDSFGSGDFPLDELQGVAALISAARD
jgi:hypothetical protein